LKKRWRAIPASLKCTQTVNQRLPRALIEQWSINVDIMSGKISPGYKLWKATDNDADVVPDTEKEMLWREVKLHFNFLDDKEELFKNWVMKKMAIAFQTFKILNKGYVKKGLRLDFEENFKK
jgi:hypothetical protein